MTDSILRTALLVLAGLTLTACGGPSVPTAAVTPTPPPKDGGTYVDVFALQKAYVDAGGNCKDGKDWGAVAYAEGTVECDDDTMIDVFKDDWWIGQYQTKVLGDDSPTPYTMLQGANWLIRSDPAELPALKEKLGGEIVTIGGLRAP